mgnify:CR=1 FL=1
MSNRLFQGLIHQMKDTVNGVIGVVDETATIIACSDLTKIGTTNEFVSLDLSDSHDVFIRDGFTYKPFGTHMRSDYAVFVEGTDENASRYASIMAITLSSIKQYYDEKYDINYHFVDFSLGAELLIYKGLYMGFFGGYGLNLNPKNGIKYTSNLYENYLEYDNDKQIVTNQSFSGMNDWFAGINLGYEFYSGLVIELNYKAGLSDIINTKSNKYDFRNSFNNTQQISLLIGYSLEFFDHETKRIQKRWR